MVALILFVNARELVAEKLSAAVIPVYCRPRVSTA